MESYNSLTRLLGADVLNAEFDSGISNGELSDSSSTCSYTSGDSKSVNHSQPIRVTKGQYQSSQEVMMFSNTSALCDSLQYILTVPELCDVTFLVGKGREPVYGVKAILATRSRVMYQLILCHQRKADSDWSKRGKASRRRVSRCLTIPVTDYSPEIFTSLLRFLHCGKVKVNITNVVGLLCAATEYGLRNLSKACWDFIRRIGHGQKDKLLWSCAEYSRKKAVQKLIAEMSEKT